MNFVNISPMIMQLAVTGKKRTGKKHIRKKRTGKKRICI